MFELGAAMNHSSKLSWLSIRSILPHAAKHSGFIRFNCFAISFLVANA